VTGVQTCALPICIFYIPFMLLAIFIYKKGVTIYPLFKNL